jgi:hypothetical protein
VVQLTRASGQATVTLQSDFLRDTYVKPNNGAFDKDYHQRGCGQKKAHFPFTHRPMNKLPA